MKLSGHGLTTFPEKQVLIKATDHLSGKVSSLAKDGICEAGAILAKFAS